MSDDDPDHRRLVHLVLALDRAAGGGSRSGTGAAAEAIETQLTETMMLQTEIWRSVQVTPSKVAPALWWRRHRAVLLPQIILVFGVLALLCGVLWAVNQYAEHRTELRVAETNRYLAQFRSGPVAKSWARLRAAWQAEGARQDMLLAQLFSVTGGAPARVRRDHQLFVLETIEEYGLQQDIDLVRHFVIRLATCVEIGSCDRDVAAAQLGPALWAFRDQHRPYFQYEYSGLDLDPYLRIIAPRPAAVSGLGSPSW